MGEEGESDRFNGTAASGVNTRGGHPRGSGGSVSVSREWQAVQDERRSKEWRQVRQICRTSFFRIWYKASVEK